MVTAFWVLIFDPVAELLGGHVFGDVSEFSACF